MLEVDVQRQILDYLGYIGAYAGKTKTMGVKRGKVWCFDKYLFKGFPDITCFYKNKIYFIEVKRKGNKQSTAQMVFESYCKSSGVDYILAYSVEDVEKILKGDK